MAYDPRNQWVLFPNKKGDNPKRPDYRGEITIEGKVYEIAGWKRTSTDGKVRLSGTVKPKEAPKEQDRSADQPSQAHPQPAPGSRPQDDEDVPF